MSLHQSIAQKLQCSRLWVDRALTIFNLIAAMEYLSFQEKAHLIALLLERTEHPPIQKELITELFSQTPLLDWSTLPEENWRSIILCLGGDSVSELLPSCLTAITGDEPAEPDEKEIATVKEEMWKEYKPPQVEMQSKEDVETIGNAPASDELQLEATKPTGTWSIIFRSYSPIHEQFHYTLLNTNRNISSSKTSARQFWTKHRPTDWPQAQISQPLCFQTPICLEEEEIIKDFQRQDGPFDSLYLFSVEQNLPNPSFTENLSINPQIQAEHVQQSSSSGLGFKIRNHTSLNWAGGTTMIDFPSRSILQSTPKTKLSWQILTQWKISLKQVLGDSPEQPFFWKLKTQIKQKLHGSGGQSGQLTLKSACFAQLKDAEKEYLIGNRTDKVELPFRPFLNPDSHRQDLFIDDDIIELAKESSLLIGNTEPTLRNTPPIQTARKCYSNNSGISNELSFSLFAEQSNQLKQKDLSLDAELSSSNIIDASLGLELIWGTTEMGFRLLIPPSCNLALAKEDRQVSGKTLSLTKKIGSISIFSNETRHFNISEEISRNRIEVKNEGTVTCNMQETWTSELESPNPIQEPYQHSLQLYDDKIGWLLSSEELQA